MLTIANLQSDKGYDYDLGPLTSNASYKRDNIPVSSLISVYDLILQFAGELVLYERSFDISDDGEH